MKKIIVSIVSLIAICAFCTFAYADTPAQCPSIAYAQSEVAALNVGYRAANSWAVFSSAGKVNGYLWSGEVNSAAPYEGHTEKQAIAAAKAFASHAGYYVVATPTAVLNNGTWVCTYIYPFAATAKYNLYANYVLYASSIRPQ